MIKSFYDIGDYITADLTDEEKLHKLMTELMIVPEKSNVKEDVVQYEVIMNLDTAKNEIQLKLGEELKNKNKEKFYAFKSPASGKRIFFASNNLYYFYTLMPDLLDYIKSNGDGINFENKDKNEFTDYIKKLDDIFYVKNPDKNERIINIELFKNDQKTKINKIINENSKGKYHKVLRSAIETFVENELIGDMKYTDISIFSLTIDGKRMSELEYYDAYRKVIQYNQFTKDIIEEQYEDKTCGCCGEIKNITPKINFPAHIKVYMTTGKNFFYKRSGNKNTRLESFAICENCYLTMYLGMLYCIEKMNHRFLDDYQMRYLIIPKNIQGNKNMEQGINKIPRLFTRKTIDLESQKKLLKDLKKYSQLKNIYMDFYFYELNSKSTGVRVDENISDISFNRIAEISKKMYVLNTSHTELAKTKESSVSFNFAYHNIFKIRATNALIKKELLSFLSSIFKERSLSYQYILRLFLRNYKGQIYDKKDKKYAIYSIYEMQLFFTWLNSICGLKGGFMKEENGTGYYEIEYPKINKYFNVHCDTFKNNHRRGLFFMGLLINEVLSQQKGKSTNFMSKIKYEGLKTRDVRKLLLALTKYMNMYRPTINGERVSLTKLNRKVYGYMTDLLLDIDQSTLTKDENLFYILSGVSFAKNVNYKSKEESEVIDN